MPTRRGIGTRRTVRRYSAKSHVGRRLLGSDVSEFEHPMKTPRGVFELRDLVSAAPILAPRGARPTATHVHRYFARRSPTWDRWLAKFHVTRGWRSPKWGVVGGTAHMRRVMPDGEAAPAGAGGVAAGG